MSLQALYAQIAQQEWIEMPTGWGKGEPSTVDLRLQS